MRTGKLNAYVDFEAEVLITRKNATTGRSEPATGLTSVQFRISATETGAAIGSLTANASERGTTGRYYAIFDTAALVTALVASHMGKHVYLIPSKSGDFDRLVSKWQVVGSTPI